MRILIHRSYLTKTGRLLILVFLFLFSCENKEPEYNNKLSDQINLLNIQRGYINDPNFKSDCLTYELFDEPCFEDLDTLNHLLRIRIKRIIYGTEIFIFKKYGIDGICIIRKYANNSCDNLFGFIGHRSVKYEVKKIYLPNANLYKESVFSLLSKNSQRDSIANDGNKLITNVAQVVVIDYLHNNTFKSIKFYSDFKMEENLFFEKLRTKFNQWPLDEVLIEHEEGM